jgi:hypothetical protein
MTPDIFAKVPYRRKISWVENQSVSLLDKAREIYISPQTQIRKCHR